VSVLIRTVALAAVVFDIPFSIHAQVSKGQQLLLNRGLQIQGLSTPDNYLHLDTYSNASYTATDWSGESSGNAGMISDFQGPPPGFAWSRWVADESSMPGMATGYTGNGVPFSRTNEIPYFSQLISLQLADEWNLNDDTTRTRLVNWFNSVQTNWPNTLLFHNNWGSQIADAQLADFYTRAHPDMLFFDTYPWQSQWDGSAPDHIGAVISGPPTSWYGDLRRYREHAKGAGIPLGIYRQVFHSVQDYNTTVYRDPSKSELRLNTFAALAFNVKFFSDFLYNSSAGSLFTKTFNGSGDSVISTNGLYVEITDINKRALNFGRALLALKPAYDLHNTNAALYPNGFPPGPASDNANFPPGITTSIQYLRGKHISGGVTNFSDVPNSFLADPDVAGSNPAGTGQAYTWWESDKNDPYLRGWVVTNKAGIKNNGLLGDAIIAWFKPLDENLDGTAYTNEIYMMVVNGLTSPDGTAADCLQQIRLNFVDTTATSKLLMLDPVSGQVVTNSLPLVTSTRRQLAVDLNGGDAVLFKFNTGAPFVGFIPPTRAQLSARKQGTTIVLSVQGTLGARYLVQTSPSLSSPTWTILTSVVLTSSPYVLTDASAAGARYYRAVGIP